MIAKETEKINLANRQNQMCQTLQVTLLEDTQGHTNLIMRHACSHKEHQVTLAA